MRGGEGGWRELDEVGCSVSKSTSTRECSDVTCTSAKSNGRACAGTTMERMRSWELLLMDDQ